MRTIILVLVSLGAFVVAGPLMAASTPATPTTAVTQGDAAPEKVPCQSKQATGLVKASCKKGGQKAAKKAMKSWTKRVKKAKKASGDTGFKLTCKNCHTSLKGAFPLKPDALAEFKKLDAWLATQK